LFGIEELNLLTEGLSKAKADLGRWARGLEDRLRTEEQAVAALLKEPNTYIYICGLKGMESGVDEAFADICRHAGLDWATLKPEMRASGRYHVETY